MTGHTGPVVVIRPTEGGVAHVGAAVAAELRGRVPVTEIAVADGRIAAWHGLRAAWRHRKAIAGADVVQAEIGRLSLGAFWTALAATRWSSSLVVTAHDLPVLTLHPGAGLMSRAPGWRAALGYHVVARLTDPIIRTLFVAGVAGWVALSDEAARAARAAGLGPVGVIEHGADPAVPGPAPSQSDYLLMTGHLGAGKGLDVLAAAWRKRSPRDGLRLIVAGTIEDESAQWLRRAKADLLDAGCVEWQGRPHDGELQTMVAGAAAVLLPYRSANPASGILVRAQTHGRPVIASALPTFRRAVDDGVEGLLVPPGDATGLAVAIDRLARDPAERDRMGQAARRRGAHRSRDRHVNDLSSFYAELRRPRRPSWLHVCQPVDGGSVEIMLALVAAAREAGYDVDVASPTSPELEARVRAIGAGWRQLDLVRSPRLSDVRRLLDVRALLRQYDGVVLHSSKAGALGRIALRLLPHRARPVSIFMPHGWSWLVGGRLAAAYRCFERRVARGTEVVVAVSEDERSEGLGVLGSRVPLRVIRNGIDPTAIPAAAPAPSAGAGPLIVCVGRLCEQKGQDLLVDALPKVRDRRARLRLVGTGPDHGALVDRARRGGVAERLELVGHDQPWSHLRAADVVAIPSRWEGLPLTLLEAMAAGTPIVTTDRVGVTLPEGCAVVVPIEAGSTAVASAIDFLLADADTRDRLGRRARQVALADFTLDRAIEAHLALWAELLARRPARAGGQPGRTAPM